MSDLENLGYSYTVTLDVWGDDPDAMTDAGVRIRDLSPIGDCSLTPGDPSPIGRTEDGDLAYPVHRDTTYMRLSRREAAELAYLLATARGMRKAPTPPLAEGDEQLLFSLLQEALPPVFWGDTGHAQVEREARLAAIFAGDFSGFRASAAHEPESAVGVSGTSG
jgi:hypothetical protein